MSRKKPSDFVPIREAAAAVDRSYSTVNSWIQRGKLKAKKRAGRRVVSLKAAREVVAELEGSPKARQGGRPVNGEMTRAEFAKRVGISERNVTRWKNEGVIKDFTEEDLAQMLEQRGGEESAQISIHRARQRKEAAQAEMAELKLARERDELYEVENVHRVIRRLADACRNELQYLARALPPRIARQLVSDRDDQVQAEAWVRSVLLDESRNAMQRLAEVTIDVDTKRA